LVRPRGHRGDLCRWLGSNRRPRAARRRRLCYIVDRKKDIIIRGGKNIYSSEVENILYDHPAVTDAALVGIPHRTLGEEPRADASEDDLKGWVRGRLAPFKVPVRIIFSQSSTLPRNANGKIMKRDLKGLFEMEPSSHPVEASRRRGRGTLA
jgi:acyl-CoA synthetase (AMP-forming)/AMP-acid ligase II